MSQPSRRRTQQERTGATRGAVVAAARELFASQGYARVSVETLIVRAGVTRGALYHHFDSKAAVFLAVFEAVEQDLSARLATTAARAPDAWARLRAGCRGFLAACLEAEVQQVVLLDAPAVLGAETVRRVEEANTMALLRSGLAAAAAEGHIPPDQVAMLAELLLGGLSQCALSIARAGDPRTTERQAGEAVDTVLEGVRSTFRA